MKIKIFSFFTAALFFFGSVQAQNSTGQIRAGVNLANISVNNDGDVEDANMLTSFQVGVLGDFPLASIVHLQTGLVFTGKGAKVQRAQPGSAFYYKATTNPYYIEVPANLLLKLPLGSGSSFNVGAGPYVAVGIAGKQNLETAAFTSERSIRFSNDDPTTFNEEEGTGFGVLKRFDYGMNGTVGIEGKSIVLSANYGLGLAKLQSGSNSSADNNNKHRVLSFTLGFKL